MDSEEPSHSPSLCMHWLVKVPARNRFSIVCIPDKVFFKAAEGVVPIIEYQSVFNYAVLYAFSYSTHAQYGKYTTIGAFVITTTHHTIVIYNLYIDRYGAYLFTECSIGAGDVFLVSYYIINII